MQGDSDRRLLWDLTLGFIYPTRSKYFPAYQLEASVRGVSKRFPGETERGLLKGTAVEQRIETPRGVLAQMSLPD